MAKDNRRGINDFYFVRGDREPEPEPIDIDEPVQASAEKKPDPEYKIISLSIIEPEGGFRINKPFEIRGKVENLHLHEITNKKILLYPVGKYNKVEDEYVPEGIEVSINNDLEFSGTCKYLFEAQPYVDDRNKPEDATWELFCRAEARARKRALKAYPLNSHSLKRNMYRFVKGITMRTALRTMINQLRVKTMWPGIL